MQIAEVEVNLFQIYKKNHIDNLKQAVYLLICLFNLFVGGA